MHLTLKNEATRPAKPNFLQQQARCDECTEEFNVERPYCQAPFPSFRYDRGGWDGRMCYRDKQGRLVEIVGGGDPETDGVYEDAEIDVAQFSEFHAVAGDAGFADARAKVGR